MDQAIAMFRQTLKETPLTYNIESYEDCLADAYLQLGEWDRALAEYQRILRINPNFPLVHYKMALAYEKQGKELQARTAYKQFLHVWKNADANIPEVQRAKQRLAS
jgi:tetratricopeptide (TPR) repeat protein